MTRNPGIEVISGHCPGTLMWKVDRNDLFAYLKRLWISDAAVLVCKFTVFFNRPLTLVNQNPYLVLNGGNRVLQPTLV